MNDKFIVYVLQSKTTGKIYIGQTSDIEKRLKQHNDKDFDKRSYTHLQGKNWVLIYSETYKSRKEATKREKQLKSYRGREFIKQRLAK